MSRTSAYYEYDPTADLVCSSCGWAGFGEQTRREVFDELMTQHCPVCDRRLVLVLFPTYEETREAARLGNEEAIRALPGFERSVARGVRAERLMLTTTSVLPEVDQQSFAVDWDFERRDDEIWTVLRVGPLVLWRELAFYEGYQRFVTVLGILQDRYPGRIRELRPTDNAVTYLYGDAIRAVRTVEKANESLRLAADAAPAQEEARAPHHNRASGLDIDAWPVAD